MSCVQKKLMILGAGPSQLPAIRKAVKLGCYVITVDYLPENIGHKFSHQFINCSTVDKERVLKIAKELAIDGILTFASDVATSTVGFVAEQLGLPGGKEAVALCMSNKASFRSFQHEHGLNCPVFIFSQSLQEVEEQIEALSPPLVFKPVNSSGSRGISTIEEINHTNCARAFEYAQHYGLSGIVCVEEFVPGIDCSGDGFLINGRLYAVVTQKYKKGVMPTGHSLPTNLSGEEQERVFAEVVAHCRAMGYLNGPLDFDVRVSEQRVTILEMSPRLGGNGIPMIIARGTGVDLLSATIHFALGQKVEFPEKLEVVRSCGSLIFGSGRAGQLQKIASEEEVKAAVPDVFEFVVYYKIGHNVAEFVHSAHALGYTLFDCPPDSNYQQIVTRIKNVLQLQVV